MNEKEFEQENELQYSKAESAINKAWRSFLSLHALLFNKQSRLENALEMCISPIVILVIGCLIRLSYYREIFNSNKAMVIGSLVFLPVVLSINYLIYWLIARMKNCMAGIYMAMAQTIFMMIICVVCNHEGMELGRIFGYLGSVSLVGWSLWFVLCIFDRVLIKKKLQGERELIQGYYLNKFQNEREKFDYETFLKEDQLYNFDIPDDLRELM